MAENTPNSMEEGGKTLEEKPLPRYLIQIK
jgi:hypothetical protein